MIQISEPPDIHGCGACSRPLTWLYSYRRDKPVAFVVDVDDPDLIRRHRCREPFESPRTWQTLVPVPAEVKAAGVRRARAVLAAKPKERTDVG